MVSAKFLAVVGLVWAIGLGVFLNSKSGLKLKVAVELLGWDGFMAVARESMATRLLGVRETPSRIEYHKFLDLLRDVDLKYCVPERRVVSELDISDCHRFVTHLTANAFLLFFENDPDFPHLSTLVGPHRKVLGDNPDALYFGTTVNADHDYVIEGVLEDEVYLSFTVHEQPCVGCFLGNVIADFNHRSLVLDANRKYSILLSSQHPPKDFVGNFLRLKASTSTTSFPFVISRHYFENQIPAQMNQSISPQISIRRIDSPVRSTTARRLHLQRFEFVSNYVRAHSIEMLQDPGKAPSWFSFRPNVFGNPVVFRNESMGAGAVDIVYSAGPFKFNAVDTEGLLITGRMPECIFANLVLWNQFMQSFSYEDGNTISLNRKQLVLQADGSFSILLSKRKPVHLFANTSWLDSEGRTDGTMFWRFLLVPLGDRVETPQVQLIPDVDRLYPDNQ